jgi:hypothetical protein
MKGLNKLEHLAGSGQDLHRRSPNDRIKKAVTFGRIFTRTNDRTVETGAFSRI